MTEIFLGFFDRRKETKGGNVHIFLVTELFQKVKKCI